MVKPSTQSPLRLVILGATGFVGTTLLRKILDLPPGTVEVRALIRDPKNLRIAASTANSCFKYFKGDLLNIPKELFFKEPHGVMHFATKQVDTDKTGFSQINIQGTTALLLAIPPTTQWIIYGSSASVYGQSAQRGAREDHLLSPQTALARSRQEAEELILTSMTSANRSALVLRPRFILGEGDHFTLPGFINLFRKGIRVSHGNQRYSIIEVSDYAEIILKLARYLTLKMDSHTTKHSICSALNIAYSQSVSFNELAAVAAKEMGTPEILKFKIPIPDPVLHILRGLPFQIPRFEKLLTQIELVGLDHSLSVKALEQLIGNEILARPPLTLVNQAMKHLIQNTGDQNLCLN